MLQAWIASPRESLYFAAAATPYNLRSLHRHVRRMQRRLHGRLHLTLRRDVLDVGVEGAAVEAFLQRLASAGVDVTLADANHSRPADRRSVTARLSAARAGDNGDGSSAPPTTV